MSLISWLGQLGQSRRGIGFIGTSRGVTWTTYAELSRLVAASAKRFAEEGLRPGDRAILVVRNDLEHIVAFLAIMAARAIPVSVKPFVPGVDYGVYVGEVARQQSATFCYRTLPTPRATQPLAWEPWPATQPYVADDVTSDGIAFIQYSSGSTSLPKPIPLTHGAVQASADAVVRTDGRDEGWSGLLPLPLHHDMGLVGGLCSALAVGNSFLLVEPQEFVRRPLHCLELAHASASQLVMGLPDSLLRHIAARLARRPSVPTDLFKGFRTLYLGAEPIRRRTVSMFLEQATPFGFDPGALVFSYGMAEATLVVTTHRLTDLDTSFDTSVLSSGAACLGRPIEGLELRVLHHVDGFGRVQVRGISMFNGYDGSGDFRSNWFDTGDLGYVNDGNLFLCGRREDRVLVNGVNLFVVDIEQVVRNEDGVEDCIVLPHDGCFDLYVVPHTSQTLDETRLSAALARAFAVTPRRIRTGARRPIVRNAGGKIVRPATRQKLAEVFAERTCESLPLEE